MTVLALNSFCIIHTDDVDLNFYLNINFITSVFFECWVCAISRSKQNATLSLVVTLTDGTYGWYSVTVPKSSLTCSIILILVLCQIQ